MWWCRARRKITGRPIDHDGFVRACHKIVPNVENAIAMFRSDSDFLVSIIKKDDLNRYDYIEKPSEVDNCLKMAYNRIEERLTDEQAEQTK
jgi:hypothetical protein